MKFAAEVCDLGTIRETDGVATCTFTFTNTGRSPLVIERVNVECGCTVPEYSREPVMPGGTETINIAFNPANYAGRVSKSVTVVSNGGKNRSILKVRAHVIPRPRSNEETYPYTIAGGLRADKANVAFQYIEQRSLSSMTVGLVNTSPGTINISVASVEGSGRLQVAVPSTLSAGEMGTVTLSYDLTGGAPVYGMISDRVYLLVNGAVAGLPINTNAIGVDDFSVLTGQQAPACSISPVYHNFGNSRRGDELTREFRITNTGELPLVVRSVAPRANTRCDLAEGTVIPPGHEVTFEATLRVENRGVTTGGITIIVNDPERPMRELRLAAESRD